MLKKFKLFFFYLLTLGSSISYIFGSSPIFSVFKLTGLSPLGIPFVDIPGWGELFRAKVTIRFYNQTDRGKYDEVQSEHLSKLILSWPQDRHHRAAIALESLFSYGPILENKSRLTLIKNLCAYEGTTDYVSITWILSNGRTFSDRARCEIE